MSALLLAYQNTIEKVNGLRQAFIDLYSIPYFAGLLRLNCLKLICALVG